MRRVQTAVLKVWGRSPPTLLQSFQMSRSSILKSSTYDDCDDLSGLDIDYRDGEQLFLLEELQAIMRNLDEVRGRLIYLSLPVREVSRLHKNESGRYETDGGHYYTCGSPIEALVEDEYHEVPYWVWTATSRGRTFFPVSRHGPIG